MNDERRIITTDAYIITQTDFGEKDKIYTIYTRNVGKLKAIAKSVRKQGSRKAGHLQTVALIRLTLAQGRSFWIITHAQNKKDYSEIKNDLEKTAYAFYIFELLDRLTADEESDILIFDLMNSTLSHLEDSVDLFMPIRFFEFQLLKRTGYSPQLNICVQCGKKILPEDQYFSSEFGGILCPACGRNDHFARLISTEVLKYLRFIHRSSFNDLIKAKISKPIKKEMTTIMQYYLSYICERKLNSPEFINNVKIDLPGNEID